MKKILFTGGGSAGHVIPNIALIEELLSSGDTDVCYVGTNGIEKEIVSAYPVPYYEIRCPKLVRGGGARAFKKNLSIPLQFLRAVRKAKKGLELLRPDLVFSKGGYVALPVVFAAKKLGIPCVAHESDLSAGLANRLSAKKCRCVFTSFPETASELPHGKYGGALIRHSVLSVPKAQARQAMNIPQNAKVLLVFGGGSGSRAINEALRASVKALTEKYLILHVCGKGNAVESNLKNYRQFEFIKDMGTAYACADLIISRAGSGTVFEILALKKPSILIPLEGATRGDQKQNAEYFQRKGLCRLLPQANLHRLTEEIENAFSDTELQRRLRESNYTQGNARILNELRAIMENG